jgi:thiol-disulfide isomerase/thioredoxin
MIFDQQPHVTPAIGAANKGISAFDARRLWRTTMRRYIAILELMAALMLPAAASAAVTGGDAAPQVPPYQARGASEIAQVGPLAPSLQGKPTVVRIHADWCPACKATQSMIDDLKRTYAGKINFVQFDVTNAKTAAAAQAEAQNLGLEKFYAATKAATSTVAVIDPKTGKVLATFYNDDTIGDYEMALNDALKAEIR